MNIQYQLQSELQEIVASLGVSDVVPSVSLSPNPDHGEFSSNVAMILAKKLGKSPMEVADNVASHSKQFRLEVEKIEVVKPGFINFFVKKEIMEKQIEALGRHSREGGNPIDKGEMDPWFASRDDGLQDKKITVEFTDPNPFKEFHIGHLYSNIVGESVARLFESQGAEVTRACYQGDVGMHVAKAIYGIQNKESRMKEIAEVSTQEQANFLGEAYAFGAKAYEEDEGAKREVTAINKKIYERSDLQINELYDLGKKWSINYFDSIYKRLGTKFDKFYFESEVAQDGIDLVNKGLTDGLFVKENGAVIFKGEEYGLHTRVFLNSLGLPTYEAKELGLAVRKDKETPSDVSVIVTGNEIKEYFKVFLKVISLIKPELAAKTKHITHGMVRLAEGKMSSRLGNVLTGEWLLDETKKHMQSAFPDMDKQTLEEVAVGAVKYTLLKGSIGRDIAFSIDESISLEGNSGPYLQYTYVRCKSILARSEARNSKSESEDKNVIASEAKQSTSESEKIATSSPTSRNDESLAESLLLRKLFFFPLIVSQAAESFSPHLLCTYLFELAQEFNHFYQKVPVLKSEGEQLQSRLQLVEATADVMHEGLHILGIQTPEKM